MERETKICPFCGEEIPVEVKKCRYCGEWLYSNDPGLHTPIANDDNSTLPAREQSVTELDEALSFWGAIRKCFKKYADFKGKAGLNEFWYFALFVWVPNIVFFIIFYNVVNSSGDFLIPGRMALLMFLFNIATFIPMLSVGSRRLHDTGRSGWFQLLYLVPYVGFFALLILLVKTGPYDEKKMTELNEPPTSVGAAIKKCLKRYVDFNGRAVRREFWYFALFVWGVNIVFFFFVGYFATESFAGTTFHPWDGMLSMLFYFFDIAMFLPMLSVGSRRLHDTGRSGWYQLLYLVPLVGFIILWILWSREGTGDNKYGIDPE